MAIPTVFPKLRGPGVQEHTTRAQDSVDIVLRPYAQALSQTPIMGAPAPAWTTPTQLLADFTSVVGREAGYHKDALLYVHGRGGVSTVAGQAAGTPILVLPMGYRPGQFIHVPVRYSGGTVMNITIQTDGTIFPEQNVAAGNSLEITFFFLAEQ